MNAAFEQFGRSLEAVQNTVLLQMQCCVGFLEVKCQSGSLVCYMDSLVGICCVDTSSGPFPLSWIYLPTDAV